MNVSVVIFSKDRPLQLDLLLRSFCIQCTDTEKHYEINVLCSASNEEYKNAYSRLASRFYETNFVLENNFKEDLIDMMKDKSHVLFFTDDTVIIHPFSIDYMANVLDSFPQCVGFSMRLGNNCSYCYAMNRPQEYPKRILMVSSMLFRWTDADLDWGYPLEVSSSLYRVPDLISKMQDMYEFHNPNTLEWSMYIRRMHFLDKPFLLSYSQSVAFSNPINKVNPSANRAGEKPEYSADCLLTEFNKGAIIDYKPFNGLIPISCHQEVEFNIIKEH